MMMKLRFTALAMLILFLSSGVAAKKSELYASKYFSFQSNAQLNAHLFLYGKAMSCKFGKVSNDSLVHYAFKEKAQAFSTKDLATLNSMMRFYKDSLLSKDLLFDSLMRELSDHLSSGSSKAKFKTPWQNATLETLRLFEPYFVKFYWQAIDSVNRAWLNAYKNQVTSLEIEVVPELERIYRTNLPAGKIRVDLTCYATWAGAYSYKEGYCHVIFSSASKANQGDLAAEVVFHETSHFLVDKLSEQIITEAKSKNVKKELNLWHTVIFYTTGFVLEKQYKLKWQKFEPYYVQMKFPEKFPEFKTTVDGCKLYWDPYLKGEISLTAAVKNLVNYMIEKQ